MHLFHSGVSKFFCISIVEFRIAKDILKADYNEEAYIFIDDDNDIYKKWAGIITFIDFDFENEEDALKLYDAFIYRYEKYSKWYDNNLPYYKELLKASFDIRKEWRENDR